MTKTAVKCIPHDQERLLEDRVTVAQARNALCKIGKTEIVI